MCPKHRTTIYIDHELVLIAKARKINISETTENVLRSIIGEVDPEARMNELRKELRAIETAMAERDAGPLAGEITALREAFKGSGREHQPMGMNENWMMMRIREFPHIRARFSVPEAVDLMMEGLNGGN